MLGIRDIYTERIHHLTCIKCSKQINSNDSSHKMGKIEAAILFEEQGWKYIKGTGWFCESCKSSQTPVEKACERLAITGSYRNLKRLNKAKGNNR